MLPVFNFRCDILLTDLVISRVVYGGAGEEAVAEGQRTHHEDQELHREEDQKVHLELSMLI